jgi:hypothetical protein
MMGIDRHHQLRPYASLVASYSYWPLLQQLQKLMLFATTPFVSPFG